MVCRAALGIFQFLPVEKTRENPRILPLFPLSLERETPASLARTDKQEIFTLARGADSVLPCLYVQTLR